MPLVLNEDQNMLKDSAKNFCSDNTPITQLRRLRDDKDESGFDRDTWRQMVELGWAGITVPEDFGGLGFGYGCSSDFDCLRKHQYCCCWRCGFRIYSVDWNYRHGGFCHRCKFNCLVHLKSYSWFSY